MPEREFPARPNLEQYKKQAKELARECAAGKRDAVMRVMRHHPRFAGVAAEKMSSQRVALADAQLVIAREHGLESWPKFAAHINTLNLERELEQIDDPVAAFVRAACVPREGWHASGTLEEAEMIVARHPGVTGPADLLMLFTIPAAGPVAIGCISALGARAAGGGSQCQYRVVRDD
jgi:hypothetical protein